MQGPAQTPKALDTRIFVFYIPKKNKRPQKTLHLSHLLGLQSGATMGSGSSALVSTRGFFPTFAGGFAAQITGVRVTKRSTSKGLRLVLDLENRDKSNNIAKRKQVISKIAKCNLILHVLQL